MVVIIFRGFTLIPQRLLYGTVGNIFFLDYLISITPGLYVTWLLVKGYEFSGTNITISKNTQPGLSVIGDILGRDSPK